MKSSRVSEEEYQGMMQHRTLNSTVRETSRSPKRETDKVESPVPQSGHCRRCEIEGGGFCRCGCLECVAARKRARGLTNEKLIRMMKSGPRHDYKADLVEQFRFRGIPVESEFKIFESRRFKADWRVTDTRILIEFEGGLFASGKQGHSSVAGILRDIEKYNLCALGGWIVIRVTPSHVVSGEALQWIEMAVECQSIGVR